MKIAVIGSGVVGRTLAARLAGLGHEVAIGTRDVAATLAATSTPSPLATPPFSTWQAQHPEVALMSFADAGAFGEVVLNATHGAVSLQALETVGEANLAGKVLLDVALPLDLSGGIPPTLTVANDDSLGEQIQRRFPATRVVKTLNTVFCEVMVDPSLVPGDHVIFVAGDDEEAKSTARGILRDFGWPDERIVDLGGIEASRGTEMYMRLYFQLAALTGDFRLNIALHGMPFARG